MCIRDSLATVMALVAWRTVLGGLNAFSSNSGTMLLGFPEYVVYAAMVPPLALTALIALHQGVFGFAEDASEANPEFAV
jgi:TRAP-type C4-dicarboxylate transport system permease small subunit